MAFSVEDFHDLVRLLGERPEWRGELRRLVLSEDLLELPEVVRELAQAQRRTEERLERLAESVGQLAGRLDEVAKRVGELVGAQRRTEEQLARLSDHVGELRGWQLEWRYRVRAPAYFGSVLRPLRVVESQEVDRMLGEEVGPEKIRDVLLAGVVLAGRPAGSPEDEELWLVVEVSGRVNQNDVRRAERRSAVLRELGLRSIGVAAGEGASGGAEMLAEEMGVGLITDGHVEQWSA